MSFIEDKFVERGYRAYVTDALKVIAENIAHIAGGSVMSGRWADQFNEEKTDTRTGDEIARDIIKGAGLVYAGGE